MKSLYNKNYLIECCKQMYYQIGGPLFALVTGAKIIFNTPNTKNVIIQMKIELPDNNTNKNINKLTIELMLQDTYRVSFYSNNELISIYYDVYYNQLIKIFEDETNLIVFNVL